MKFYLSSYLFGDHVEELKRMMPSNKKIGHINNAQDYSQWDPVRSNNNQIEQVEILNSLGFEAESLDLKNYFGKQDELESKLSSLGGLWISGGNTFVLRQAMALSGFDELFPKLQERKDFLYSGYSAGICILAPSLRTIDQVDDPFDYPYGSFTEPLWDGLGVFDYSFMPHYDSDHPESELIDAEIKRCEENNWPYKALRDGEVLIIEN